MPTPKKEAPKPEVIEKEAKTFVSPKKAKVPVYGDVKVKKVSINDQIVDAVEREKAAVAPVTMLRLIKTSTGWETIPVRSEFDSANASNKECPKGSPLSLINWASPKTKPAPALSCAISVSRRAGNQMSS